MSSQQPESPKTTIIEPKLCKMGCGFFGNNATGDCCSKCWAEIRPKDGEKSEKEPQPSQVAVTSVDKLSLTLKPEVASAPADETTVAPATHPATGSQVETLTSCPAKTKKKKISYKSMMAGMLEANGSPRKDEKEKERMRDGMGGGHFKKIDRI